MEWHPTQISHIGDCKKIAFFYFLIHRLHSMEMCNLLHLKLDTRTETKTHCHWSLVIGDVRSSWLARAYPNPIVGLLGIQSSFLSFNSFSHSPQLLHVIIHAKAEGAYLLSALFLVTWSECNPYISVNNFLALSLCKQSKQRVNNINQLSKF